MKGEDLGDKINEKRRSQLLLNLYITSLVSLGFFFFFNGNSFDTNTIGNHFKAILKSKYVCKTLDS